MKTKLTIITALLLLICASLFIGCDTLDKAYTKQAVWHDPVTNQIVTLITNDISVPAFTNPVTGAITPPTIQRVVTPRIDVTVTEGFYTTNLVDRPSITGTTELIGSLPIPWASTIAAVFGGLYAFYRNIRNKKALVAVIQGVEAFRKTMQTPELKPLDDKLKNYLVEHQEIGGVLNVVANVVNATTGDTVPPK